jgi:hypothetical protein
MNEALNEILSAVAALEENARKVRQIMGERGGWTALHPSEAAKIMTEMKHDFADGLKHATALEAKADADYDRVFRSAQEVR